MSGNAAGSARKPRRPKPLNYGQRRTLRFGTDEEAAVAAMRQALGKNRGVDAEQVPFSEGLRLLLTENLKAAQVLAGQPDAWATSGTIDLPIEVWDGLTECRNRLSHSQGSLYGIVRKLNFGEDVTPDEAKAAFADMAASKAAIEHMESLLLDFISHMESVAAAKDVEAA